MNAKNTKLEKNIERKRCWKGNGKGNTKKMKARKNGRKDTG